MYSSERKTKSARSHSHYRQSRKRTLSRDESSARSPGFRRSKSVKKRSCSHGRQIRKRSSSIDKTSLRSREVCRYRENRQRSSFKDKTRSRGMESYAHNRPDRIRSPTHPEDKSSSGSFQFYRSMRQDERRSYGVNSSGGHGNSNYDADRSTGYKLPDFKSPQTDFSSPADHRKSRKRSPSRYQTSSRSTRQNGGRSSFKYNDRDIRNKRVRNERYRSPDHHRYSRKRSPSRDQPSSRSIRQNGGRSSSKYKEKDIRKKRERKERYRSSDHHRQSRKRSPSRDRTSSRSTRQNGGRSSSKYKERDIRKKRERKERYRSSDHHRQSRTRSPSRDRTSSGSTRQNGGRSSSKYIERYRGEEESDEKRKFWKARGRREGRKERDEMGESSRGKQESEERQPLVNDKLNTEEIEDNIGVMEENRAQEFTDFFSDLSGVPSSSALPPSSEYIILKVVGQDSNEIHFRVKQTIKMEKLKKSYSERVGLPITSLWFMFDGRHINDDETPEALEMEENDIIVVFDEFPGMLIRNSTFARPMPSRIREISEISENLLVPSASSVPPKSEYITLKVVGEDGVELHFRVKPTTKLGLLKEAYSHRISVPMYILRFLFDGRRINDDETAIDLEMEDNDVIDVFHEQGGTPWDDAIGPWMNYVLGTGMNFDDVQVGHPPLDPRIIQRIPTGLISEAQAAAKISCSICLEDFSVGQEMKQLECCHMFHVPCIEKWLKMHGTCPVCRQVPNPVADQ